MPNNHAQATASQDEAEENRGEAWESSLPASDLEAERKLVNKAEEAVIHRQRISGLRSCPTWVKNEVLFHADPRNKCLLSPSLSAHYITI